MITDINSEDRLVQATFADHLRDVLGGKVSLLTTRRPLARAARSAARASATWCSCATCSLRCNGSIPSCPPTFTSRRSRSSRGWTSPFARSAQQGVLRFHPQWRSRRVARCRRPARHARARVIDFRDATQNRFLAVRELKVQGLRVPHYNRRADLVCFVNGLPLVFIELKAVYLNMRAGFDNNLTDYLSETSINHAFHHNAFLVVSNGDRRATARSPASGSTSSSGSATTRRIRAVSMRRCCSMACWQRSACSTSSRISSSSTTAAPAARARSSRATTSARRE